MGMTEQRWLRARDYHELLEWVRPRTSARKKRLLTVAACRLAPLDEHAWLAAMDVVERYAEGRASREEMLRARRQLRWVDRGPQPPPNLGAAMTATYLSNSECCNAVSFINPETITVGGRRWDWRRYQSEIAELIREVIGNPFRPSAIDPAWLAFGGGQVVRLAEGIYEERAFDRMPVLGDALEDAGCSDGAILGHCREKRRHVRGCWALDLVLGKE